MRSYNVVVYLRYLLYTFHALEFHFNKYDNLWYRYLGLVDSAVRINGIAVYTSIELAGRIMFELL